MATIERAGTRPSWAARSASRRFSTLTRSLNLGGCLALRGEADVGVAVAWELP